MVGSLPRQQDLMGFYLGPKEDLTTFCCLRFDDESFPRTFALKFSRNTNPTRQGPLLGKERLPLFQPPECPSLPAPIPGGAVPSPRGFYLNHAEAFFPLCDACPALRIEVLQRIMAWYSCGERADDDSDNPLRRNP
jgi:hypothetical protein